MAYLNQLLSAADLAKLSESEREFLVQRIDHVLDTHPDVRRLVADGVKESLDALQKSSLHIRPDSIKAAVF